MLLPRGGQKIYMEKLTQAIILAGGLGSRLGSMSKALPKPLQDISGTPFLDYLIGNLAHQGVADIVISAGYLAEVMVEKMGDGSRLGVGIRYAVEKEALGTGGGTCLAAALLRPAEAFLVVNGDTLFDISLVRMAEYLSTTEASAVIALRRTSEAGRYGEVVLSGDGSITAFKEKSVTPGNSGLINGGIYAFKPGVLEHLPSGFSSLEYDLFPRLAELHLLKGCEGCGFFLDIGLPDTLAQAQYLLPAWRKERNESSRQLGRLESENEKLGKTVAELEQSVGKQQSHIEKLLEVEREYERFKQSRGGKVARALQRSSGFLLPVGSKRRLFVKTGLLFARHPGKFLHSLNLLRIKAYFRMLHSEGPLEVSRRLSRVVLQTGAGVVSSKPISVMAPAEDEKRIENYEPLTFPVHPHPRVSIVIPAHNHFDFTYACLRSILRHTDPVPYELIIGDDASVDATRQVEIVVKNIRLMRNRTNAHFIATCNKAAKLARGDYLFFLNNDTQVQPGWLSTLVELLDNDPSIGLSGSKLVFPDGTLQEAGGIIWRDGSAWNYGRGRDPACPDFNYLRETDYISGAAIIIRRKLWEKIGGFASYLTQVYCEDSDLAFRVRELGYRVVYQPESLVMHFEGVTNGTDVKCGIKAYQAENEKKFYSKWRAVLEREHFPNGENVFQARGRSAGKKLLLVVDHYVPQYDKDAGSRTVFQYLTLFRRMGLEIVFIPDNFFYDEKYVKILQSMGIFVLYGYDYAMTWKEWLRENGKYFNFVLLNRPHISIKYIDAIRAFCPGARVIYYGHDLHFLREQREYDLKRDPALLADIRRWKDYELELMRKSDIACYPSTVEIELIREIDPKIHCRVMPMNVFPHVEELSYGGVREGLLFVGGFAHRPNVDGMLWFANAVMPLIRRQRSDIVLSIVGSNPPEAILNLQGDGITVVGYVSDAELRNYYSRCRMSVVPLAYGAGVKGKLVEALYYQLPVVTTSIGAEGLLGIEKVVAVRDDAAGFASAILDLYDNEAALQKMARAEYDYVSAHFSMDKIMRVVEEELGIRA